MRLSKKYYSIIIGTFIALNLVSTTHADESCKECTKKELDGIPKLPLQGLDKVAKAMDKEKNKEDPFAPYIGTLCIKYTQIIANELGQTIRDLKETPYPVEDYLQKAECKPEQVGGIKSPVIHLTAEAPCGRIEFPEIIHKYYTVKRKEPALWLKVINSKNTDGETYLDYIEKVRDHNLYNTTEAKECVNQLIRFACKTGAVYSKVKNISCPTGL
jgi:hypothetical protein